MSEDKTKITRREMVLRTAAGAGGVALSTVLSSSHAIAAPSRPARATGRTYVLVHGAWYGGWVWRDVAPALRAMGNTVTTPTLTGLGERKNEGGCGYDLETHVQDVVNHIEMEDLKGIHLVGWSYGGIVVTGVLARVPERIKSVIYLDAHVPDDGKRNVDYAEPAAKPMMEGAKKNNKPVPPIPLVVFGVKDPAVVAFVEPRLVAQAWQTFLQPVKALKTRPNIPFTYIRCTDFNNPSFDEFLEKFKKDPQFTTYVLKTSHLSMLTGPKGTIDLLARAK
jgi:pimeloyl-ACP methyl ester carboxylesterase